MRTVACCVCGVGFCLTDELHRARMEDGGIFVCPNGHRQHFTESTQAKLDAANERIVSLRRSLEREREAHQRTWRRLVAQRAATSRLRNLRAREAHEREDAAA